MNPRPRRGVSFAASTFGAQVAVTTGTNCVLALLSVLTGVLAARLLGPTGRGELAAIQMWPGFLAGLANLGLPQALTFFSAQSPKLAGRYLASAMWLGLLASLPFMLVGVVVLPVLLTAQPASVVSTARWYLLLLPIQAVESMPYHMLRGRSDFNAWNALRLGPSVGWLGLLLFGWSFGRATPPLLAVAYLMVLAILAVPNLYLASRRVAGPFYPDPPHWRPMLRYGLPTVLSGVPQVLNLRVDQMLMAAFLPVQTLGLYVVAVTWSSAVGQLPNALATVILPRTAAQPDLERRRLVFAQGSRLAVLTAGSVAVVVALITPWSIRFLFGEQFTAAVPAALVLVGAAAVLALNLVLEEGLRGLGQPATVLWAETAGLAVTAAALLVLLKPFAIMGAALASLFGYSAVTIALIAASAHYTGQSIATLLWPNRRDLEQMRERLVIGATRVPSAAV